MDYPKLEVGDILVNVEPVHGGSIYSGPLIWGIYSPADVIYPIGDFWIIENVYDPHDRTDCATIIHMSGRKYGLPRETPIVEGCYYPKFKKVD